MFTIKINAPLTSPSASLLEKAQKGLDSFKDIPLFSYLTSSDAPQKVIGSLSPLIAQFQQFEDVFILGTGGSSLGGKTLYDLCDNPKVRLHFLDNIDPHTFHCLFKKILPSTTGVIVISKSGKTSETLMQLLVCLKVWQSHDLDPAQHFAVVTEPHENPLRQLANFHGMMCFDHPTDIGGRYSVFTIVGLLPALLAGLDGEALIRGGRSVLESAEFRAQACNGAVTAFNLTQHGVHQSVLLPYIDRLNTFALWYRQLWAESLGKNGVGTTPIASFGTVDQHSQFQLYLDGPKDKFFTVMTMDHQDPEFVLSDLKDYGADLQTYAHKTMGQLMMAEQKAAIDTLVNQGCPVRHMHITTANEEVLGGLFVYFILETLAMSTLLQVDPFSQPAVEEGKILTRKYLLGADSAM